MTRAKTTETKDEPGNGKEEPATHSGSSSASNSASSSASDSSSGKDAAAAAGASSEQDGVAKAKAPSSKASKKGKKKFTKKRSAKLADLQEQLSKANEQVVLYKEQALRAEAEMQNVRKRVVRDVENAHKYGTERLLQSLLPTVDSLEKSVEAAAQVSDANAGLVEGIEICLKMLMDVLAKENVEQIDPEGEPFDPQFHEAISMVEKPEMEPNSVALVVQKGYRLNGRLVRPAMVIVSKAEEGTAQDGAAAEGTAEDKGAPSGGAQDGAAPTESPSGGAPGGNAPNGKAAQDRAAEDNDGPKGDTPRIDEKA